MSRNIQVPIKNKSTFANQQQSQQVRGGGLLHIMIIKAELTRDTDYFLDMDPYVEVTYKKEVQKTPVLHNAGKTPEWFITMSPILIDQLEDYI